MKNYTDLEQSKKLAEILPLESADMYYMETSRDNYTIGVLQRMEMDMLLNHAEYYKMSPCWSLTALLELLSFPNLFYNDGWNLYVTINNKIVNINNADNPIDAAFEMICLLKEKNLL